MKYAGIRTAMLTLAALSVVIALAAPSPQYVGAEKCKMCHMSKAKGDAYGIWKASKHAAAFATLASPESQAIAKKMGIADAQKSAQCLQCHVTGHSAPPSAKAASYKLADGVGCETCHGAGSLYKEMKVMRALHAGTQDAKTVGYRKGDKRQCVSCHNPSSPTYKPFNVEEAYKKIAHPTPKG
ncbi:MAG TPA: cytochrome c family protein [bacterium]|nr:cytochrome c family protein [bacterium]HPN36225.1 cytochrome c family protein [bacterium]